MNTEQQVDLPKEGLDKAQKRAAALGLTLAEYVQTLVQDDVHSLADPWRQPLPWEVEKQYLLDEIEFYEQEKKQPQKEAHSADELVKLLDEEIQQLDRDETD
jgi:hypothetical protein